MNDDISRLLKGNVPDDAPSPTDFGPRARALRRRRQAVAGLAITAVIAVPLGLGLTQLGGRPTVFTTPTHSSSATPTPTVAPTTSSTRSGTPTSTPTPSLSEEPPPVASTPIQTVTPVETSDVPQPTDPSPSVPTDPSPSVPATVPTQTLGTSGVATFQHFTVELKPITQEGSGRYPSFQVEVCVVSPADPEPDGTTRVSTNPWQLVTSDGQTLGASPSTEFTPAYPAVSRLQVGECVSGWLEFRGGDGGFSERLVYQNSVGERAEWTLG